MQRRAFLQLTGIAGILAAHRAPAFAQGTKLHIVRWVDFIPEADVELKRQAPEASKALGAEVTFETINANDLQPRITAAVQSGSGADIFQMLVELGHLYANALVDVSDVAEPIGKAQGGFYDVFDASAKVGRQVAGRSPRHRAATRSPTASRGTPRSGSTEFPKTWDAWREAGKKLKAKGKPVGQALGHSFGDAPTFSYPLLWGFGGAETDAERQEGRHQLQGGRRVGEVPAGVLEGRLRRGRPRLGRHQQQPRLPRRRAQRHPQRGVDLHRRQAAEGQDQGRQGRAALAGHRPRRPAAGRAQRPGRSLPALPAQR